MKSLLLPSPHRALLLALPALLALACSSTTNEPRSTGPDVAAGASGADGGTAKDDPNRPPTCAESVDFQSDPQNCGRCGRVCDDGACHHGSCAPRVEATYDSRSTLSCVDDYEVVGGVVFIANYTDGLFRVHNGASVSVDPGGNAALSTDAKALFAVSKEGGLRSGKVLKRYTAAGALLETVHTQGTKGIPFWTATDGKIVATMGYYGGSTLDAVSGAAHDLFDDITMDAEHDVQLVGADLYTSLDYGGVSRYSGSTWKKVVSFRSGVASWVVAGGHLYKTDFVNGAQASAALFECDLDGGKEKTITPLDRDAVRPLAPPDWIIDPGATSDARFAVVVSDGQKLYVFILIAGLHAPGTPDLGSGTVIAELGADRKLRTIGAASPGPDVTTQREIKVRGGRVYWRSGVRCGYEGGGKISSIPL